MLKWNNIQERFNITFNIIKNNFIKYILLNLWLIWIWFIIFCFFVLLFILLWFFSLWINYSVFLDKINNLDSLWFNFIMLIIVFIIFLIFLYWVLKSIYFIWNFYFTKWIVEKKDISYKELFKLSFLKLFDKALVDFWYFIIDFWAILLILLVWWFFFFLKIDYSILSFLFLLSLTILWIWFLIYINILFFFSDYHCFYKDKFDFKTFLSAKDIVSWRKMEVFLNIILISVFIGIISILVWFILPGYTNNNFDYNTYTYNEILSMILSVWFILSIIFKYIIRLILNIFSLIYFFIYYKVLVQKNTLTENNLENKE